MIGDVISTAEKGMEGSRDPFSHCCRNSKWNHDYSFGVQTPRANIIIDHETKRDVMSGRDRHAPDHGRFRSRFPPELLREVGARHDRDSTIVTESIGGNTVAPAGLTRRDPAL